MHDHTYSLADAALNKRAVEIDHPDPTGAMFLSAAGLTHPDGYALFAMLPNGDFEDIRPSERMPHQRTREFIAFRTDRLYRFMLDERQLAWGEDRLSGATLDRLLGAKGKELDIFQCKPDGTEAKIEANDTVRLDAGGTERLITRPKAFTIFINGKRRTTTKKVLSFEELILLAFENPPTGECVQFTIQYARGPEANASGTLLEGQSVTIKNGIEFDVTPTNRS